MQSELFREGYTVSITRLCRWLKFPRRSFYYQSVNREKRLDPNKVATVKEKTEEYSTYDYRRLALLLRMNKKTVQRIWQLKGWQVKNVLKGIDPGPKQCLQKQPCPIKDGPLI